MTSYRRKWHFVVALLAWAALIPLRPAHAFQAGTTTPAAGAGQVQGKIVLDSDGSAISGVTITLVQVSATPSAISANPVNSGTVTTTPVSGGSGAAGAAATATTTSAKDGSFSVAGLATGQFAVCVKDPNATVIDPCLWTDSRTIVNVAASSLSSGLVVRVKKASTVGVRVNDAAQALVQKSTDVYPPHVLVGAFDSRGAFHPAREVQKDSTGISYQLPIPVDSPVRVTIYSAQVQLATNSNVSLPAQGYSTTFVQPSSQTRTNSFTFNAVGRN
jgi:hypothetical protein